MPKKLKSISFLLSVLLLNILFGYFIFAWQGPTQAPPGGNVPAPVQQGGNASLNNLAILGLLSLPATGISGAGAGSNLDADLLDGLQASDILEAAGGGTTGGGGGPVLEWVQAPTAASNYIAKVKWGPKPGGGYGYDCYYKIGESGNWTYQADCYTTGINFSAYLGNTVYLMSLAKSAGSAYTVTAHGSENTCSDCEAGLPGCKTGWVNNGRVSCFMVSRISPWYNCERLCTAEGAAAYSNILSYELGAAGVCGNAVLESSEACDDGDKDNTDYCRNDCTLNPDKSFIFVSSNTQRGRMNYLGNYFGLRSADSVCSYDASYAGLMPAGVNYQAWMSSAGLHAKDLLNLQFPLYNTRGEVVANTLNDLIDGTIGAQIRFDAYAKDKGVVNIWTGTQSNGEAYGGISEARTCSFWTDTYHQGATGSTGRMDSGWTYEIADRSCSFGYNLYCLRASRGSYCGDGFVDTNLGEECDDGNRSDDDNCGSNCLWRDTVVYMTTAYHNGDFKSYRNAGSGRNGADLFCQDNKPANLSASCSNIHALLNVNYLDEIWGMQSTFKYGAANPIYWFNSANRTYTKLANFWQDMCDGSILASQQAGTGVEVNPWIGSDANAQCRWGNVDSVCYGPGGAIDGWARADIYRTGGIGRNNVINYQWLAYDRSVCTGETALRCACSMAVQ